MDQANNNQPRAALTGVKVIDLTQFEAGPSCTETLAWLGADVIKVEPVKGDQGRRRTPEGVDSFYFMLLNANKRSVTVNLKDERGQNILRDLIKHGDVFVENFGPGVIEKLGFPYQAVKDINPRMIYAQIKGFAPEGPYGKFLSFDVIAQSVGGVLSTTGEKGGRPLRAGPTIGDTGSGLHTVIGILAALYQRQRTGRGQRVEVAMQDAVINFGRMAYSSLALWGSHPPRNGNQSVLKGSAPSECYRCKGGGDNDYCFVYCSRAGNHQWERLLKVIGREELLNKPGYQTPRERFANQKDIDAMMEVWTLQHDKHEVMRILGSAGIPAGAVFDTQELRDDPYLRQRGTFVTIKHPVSGDFTMPGWPFKMSDSHVPVVTSPLLGEHNEDIYGRMLGYTPQQIAQLKADSVI
jgi:formyl-CoA transferase